MKDYYKILGLSDKSSPGEIRERYRALVTSCHPDKFQEAKNKMRAEERIKEVNEAYALLRDPEQRAAYDRQRQQRRRSMRSAYSHLNTTPTHPTPFGQTSTGFVPDPFYNSPVTPIIPEPTPGT